MGGIIFGVFRSIRGLPMTIECVAYGRGWGGVSHQLFPLHGQHGIADDGSPTGLEHAVVYLGLWGPVLQLRARWYDRAAARKFRELLRSDPKDELGFAIGGAFQRFETRPNQGYEPYPALAFDLDVISCLRSLRRPEGGAPPRWYAPITSGNRHLRPPSGGARRVEPSQHILLRITTRWGGASRRDMRYMQMSKVFDAPA